MLIKLLKYFNERKCIDDKSINSILVENLRIGLLDGRLNKFQKQMLT